MDDLGFFLGLALLMTFPLIAVSCFHDPEKLSRAKMIDQCTTYITEKKARDMPELCEKLLMEKKGK